MQLWDTQAMQQQAGIDVAHRMRAWDVSWAPNNEHRFVSSGDDCKLRFWDTRWGLVTAVTAAAVHMHTPT